MTMWLPLMEGAFVLFLFALYSLVWRGARTDGALQRGAWKWALLAVGALVVWMVALGRIPHP